MFKCQQHISLVTQDVESARAFYEALGGKVIAELKRKDGSGVNYLLETVDGANIEIQLPRFPGDPKPNYWDHLAMEVENCEEACNAAVSAGARLEKPPTPGNFGGRPIINSVLYGPGGEKLEFIQFT